jgi:hypothetical protein
MGWVVGVSIIGKRAVGSVCVFICELGEARERGGGRNGDPEREGH